MRFDATADVTHPASRVFRTLRDRTPQLVYLMPNVESVEVLLREERPPVVHLHCRWQGARTDLPWIVRPFVSQESLVWHDWADWDERQLAAAWENRARMLGRECVTATGSTAIVEAGHERARFVVEGDLRIDPDNVPGLPRSVAQRLRGVLESFIVRALTPNLTSIATAVQKYLDVRQSTGAR